MKKKEQGKIWGAIVTCILDIARKTNVEPIELDATKLLENMLPDLVKTEDIFGFKHDFIVAELKKEPYLLDKIKTVDIKNALNVVNIPFKLLCENTAKFTYWYLEMDAINWLNKMGKDKEYFF